MKVADTKRLNKLIRKDGFVVGEDLDRIETAVKRKTLSRLHSIMDNVGPPLHSVVNEHRSHFNTL